MAEAMNESTALTMIEAAEATIAKLTEKRSVANTRMSEIARERSAVSYSAHVDADPAAQKKLAALTAETVRFDSELASIDDALATAKLKLETAQRAEQIAETKKAAKAAQQNYKWMIDAGKQITEHAQALAMLLDEVKQRAEANHGLGQPFPSSMQIISMLSRGISTLILTLPIRNFEHSFLPPNQRIDLGRAVADWGNTGLKNLDAAWSGLGNGHAQPKPQPVAKPREPTARERAHAMHTTGSRAFEEAKRTAPVVDGAAAMIGSKAWRQRMEKLREKGSV